MYRYVSFQLRFAIQKCKKVDLHLQILLQSELVADIDIRQVFDACDKFWFDV